MSLFKRRYSIPVVLAGVLAALAVAAAPAQAVSQRAQCGSTYVGTGWTYYNYTGGYDVISFYEYYLTAGGNQSNVDINQYSGTTRVFHWDTDSAISQSLRTVVPSSTVRIPGSASTRTGFTFVFDKDNDDDPRCTAYTPWW